MSKSVYTGYWDVALAIKNGQETRKTRYKNCVDVTVNNELEEKLTIADGTVLTEYTTTITIRQQKINKRGTKNNE